MKKIFKKIFVSSCVIFSMLVLVLCIGIAAIGVEKGFGLDHSILFALYILSFVISCTTAIYSQSKLNGALKYIIHLVVTLSSAALFLKVVNGLDGKTILIALVVISIIHAAVFIVIIAVKKSSAKEEKYEDVFKK